MRMRLSVFEISWKCCFSNYQGSVWGIVTPKVTLELISISSFESVSKYVSVVVKWNRYSVLVQRNWTKNSLLLFWLFYLANIECAVIKLVSHISIYLILPVAETDLYPAYLSPLWFSIFSIPQGNMWTCNSFSKVSF